MQINLIFNLCRTKKLNLVYVSNSGFEGLIRDNNRIWKLDFSVAVVSPLHQYER